MKKVTINLKPFLLKHSTKKTTICDQFGVSKQTMYSWEKNAPDVVHTLYYIVKENPQVDILKVLNQWQKPPFVLVFLRGFMESYGCGLMEIVGEVYN